MGWSLVEGFTKSLAMTVLSEIGDKTFFTAAILAMRHPRRIVLSGCLSALIVMTILSACLGWAAPNLVSRKWAHHVTTVLFFGFGFWSLWEGFKEDGEAEELAEVEAKLDADWKAEKGEAKSNSKLATIGLATDENPFGVILGGVIGQALCTTAAVLGGKSLASQISEKMQLSGVAIPDLLKSNLYNVQKTIDRYRMHTKEPGSTKKAIEQSIQSRLREPLGHRQLIKVRGSLNR